MKGISIVHSPNGFWPYWPDLIHPSRTIRPSAHKMAPEPTYSGLLSVVRTRLRISAGLRMPELATSDLGDDNGMYRRRFARADEVIE